MLLNQK